MINLLPSEHRVEIKKEYMLRRLIVFLAFSALLTLVAVALLVPTYVQYFMLNRQIGAQIAEIEARSKTAEGKFVEDEVVDLNAKLRIATPATTTPLLASAFADEVSASLFPGVTIGTIGYERQKDGAGTAGKASLSGIARDRATLLAFVRRLESQPHLQNVDSPVSNLTKNKNLEYSITLEVIPTRK